MTAKLCTCFSVAMCPSPCIIEDSGEDVHGEVCVCSIGNRDTGKSVCDDAKGLTCFSDDICTYGGGEGDCDYVDETSNIVAGTCVVNSNNVEICQCDEGTETNALGGCTNLCPDGCGDHGYCTSTGCVCDDLFDFDENDLCNILYCEGGCDHGICVLDQLDSEAEITHCECDEGYTGTSCDEADCVPTCNLTAGYCDIDANECVCTSSHFQGDDCYTPRCDGCGPHSLGCIDIPEDEYGNTRACICDDGWSIDTSTTNGTLGGTVFPCLIPTCDGLCKHGDCIYSEDATDSEGTVVDYKCECYDNWLKIDDSDVTCSLPNGCDPTCEHGSCAFYEEIFVCVCDEDWIGDACDYAVGCDPPCVNGTCVYTESDGSFACDCSTDADWAEDSVTGACIVPDGCGDCGYGTCVYDNVASSFDCFCDEDITKDDDGLCTKADCYCGLGGASCSYDGTDFTCSCSSGWDSTYDSTYGYDICDTPTGCSPGCDHGDCFWSSSAEEFLCDCDDGWSLDALGACTLAECEENCAHGSCFYNSADGTTSCACSDGWTTDSQGICTMVDCSLVCEHGNCGFNIVTGETQCICDDGYSGTLCEDVVCSPACANGASCVEGVCVCVGDYTGTSCQIPTCGVDGCGLYGYCVEDDDGQSCVCDENHTGTGCDTISCADYDEDHAFCYNGVLVCKSGWSGDTCETNDESDCIPPCQNGGVCNAAACDCSATEYTGPTCNTLACNGSNGCGTYGTCNAGACVCYDGYIANGDGYCEDLSCSLECENGGECQVVDGETVCVCGNYFKGDTCDIPICNSGLGCGNGFCVDDGDIGENNSCTCFHGYELDATGRCTKALCTPVCGANGTCVIVDGSPECSCNDPDHWTGSTCEIPMCPDSSDGFCGVFGTCKGDPDTADNVPYCDCFDGFTTDDYGDCTVPSCSPLCENDGICVTTSGDGTDTKCVCGDYYSGADCTEELCSNMPKGNGACIDGSPV
ncbi:hypothetical protein ADUPG1_008313, partial [Aduncisulcus paluster]